LVNSESDNIRADFLTDVLQGRGQSFGIVEADIAGLGELRGYQWAAAAAVAMARILDDHRLATTALSAAKQLTALMDALHKSATPKRGRLAVVQEMTTRA